MIRTDRAHLYVTAQTHPGMAGKNNEDNFAVSAFLLSSRNPTPCVFAIVSDGIGGHKAGEVASELAVNLISAAVEKREGGNPMAVFENSFYQASEAIFQAAEDDARYTGMGATAACAWVIGQQLFLAYVGDSRIYLIRGGQIKQLSHDHTWVQEAIDKGILDRSSARNHPNLHVIRRYLGSNEPASPDLRLFLHPAESDQLARNNQGFQLLPGDIVLLCSDGLTDVLDDEEIAGQVAGRTLQQSAQAMIDLACQREAHDNITVVMLGVPWDTRKNGPGWLPG